MTEEESAKRVALEIGKLADSDPVAFVKMVHLITSMDEAQLDLTKYLEDRRRPRLSSRPRARNRAGGELLTSVTWRARECHEFALALRYHIPNLNLRRCARVLPHRGRKRICGREKMMAA